MTDNIDDLLGDGPSEFAGSPQSSALVKPTNVALDVLTDPDKLLAFLEATRTAPFEGIDSLAVSEGYAAAVWLYRSSALMGDYKRTKALQLWIEWANMVQARPEASVEEKVVNPNVRNFLPRAIE